MQLELGSPIVRVGSVVRQLVSAPIMQKGHLMVPLQLVSDVFPLVVPNTRWDADSAQLVLSRWTLARVVDAAAKSASRPMRSVARAAPEPRELSRPSQRRRPFPRNISGAR